MDQNVESLYKDFVLKDQTQNLTEIQKQLKLENKKLAGEIQRIRDKKGTLN